MAGRLRYIGRAISLFFRLFIVRSAKVMFLPGEEELKRSLAPPPPVVVKAEQKEQQVVALGLVLLIITGVAAITFWGVKTQPYVVLAGIAVFVVGDKAWRQFGASVVSRLCREARENDGYLCLHCGYNLKGLPDQHRCPECGNPFDIEDVKEKWTAYLTASSPGAQTSAPTPPIIARLERKHFIFRTAAITPVLVLAGTLVLRGRIIIPADLVARICVYMLFLFIPAGMLLAAWMGRKINRLITQAHKARYALCIECGYCLTGLPDQHRCPECGTPYEIEQVKRRWSEYLASRAAREIPW